MRPGVVAELDLDVADVRQHAVLVEFEKRKLHRHRPRRDDHVLRAQALELEVAFAAGESIQVQFPLGPDQLRYWNAALRDWVVDASPFDVWVGGDSTAELSTTFQVAKG